MKKMLALTIAFIMSLSCVSVYASSSNSVNKTRVVRDKAEITDVYLKIVPRDEVATGDTIVLTYTNADVLSIPSFGSLQGNGNSWSSLQSQLYSDGAKTVLTSLWSKIGDTYIPWNMKKVMTSEVEVELFPIPSEYCDTNAFGSKPYYYIPLYITASADDGTQYITVTVDPNESSVSSGTYTLATMPLEGTSTTSSSSSSSSSSETETETETEEEETEETTEAAADTSSEETREISVQIGNSEVTVDGEAYTMDASPYIQTETSSTLVPLRFVAVALLGGDAEEADESGLINWDAETKTASVYVNGSTVEFTAGSSQITIGGETSEITNGVRAEITDGRMYIPFRALGEALGAEVSWDAETKTAVYIIG